MADQSVEVRFGFRRLICRVDVAGWKRKPASDEMIVRVG